MQLSRTFRAFVESNKSSGILLVACTMTSLALANSSLGTAWLGMWHAEIAGMSASHWINDGLMAVFFLLIGLELERELYSGELSDLRNALLAIAAAGGGICVPALIHYAFNAGTHTQAGIGIPMATDIAFALGVMALLGSRVPLSLKVFMTALAVMDDLGAIVVIALFYTAQVSLAYLAGALAVFAVLLLANRVLRVHALWPYLLGGALMWFLMLQSGVHATIAGVLLAFAIPYSARVDDEQSPSHRLEHYLHKPVSLAILPVFALANTAIVLGPGWAENLGSPNSVGIIAGLAVGKPLGIVLASAAVIGLGVCRMPSTMTWGHVTGAGLLGGIGFTMSIFIADLAFAGSDALVDASKLAILVASLAAGGIGYCWLRWGARSAPE